MPETRTLRLSPAVLWPLVCASMVLVLFMAIIIGRLIGGSLTVEDDAYYYLKIARNIATSGVSTFDQQSLTNGYHPLWLLVLVVQDLTVGPSILVTLSLEAMLFAAAAFLFLRAAPDAPPLLQAGFTLCFAGLMGHFGLDGMEVALLAFCLALFVNAIDWAGDGDDRRGLVVGLAAAACVGARIDSAFFIAPALAAAPLSRRGRAAAFAALGVLGAAYAAFNLSTFGMIMPVSSAIKSLGGVQINDRVVAQLGLGSDPRSHVALYWLTAVLLMASPGLVWLSRPGSKARALALAASLGGLAYLLKIVLLSSWMIWPWYNFAVLFPMIAALYAAGPRLATLAAWADDRLGGERAGRAALVASIAVLAVVGVSAALVVVRPPKAGNSFASINHLALERYGARLGGARVAMGDRAGSFAMEYPGPVVQLEGLVNDKAYLAALTRGADMRGLLCHRAVRFVIAYERDLGAYDHLQFAVLRPFLTRFRAPGLDVWRADEVGHVTDLGLYDNRRDHEPGDNTLYIWRLRCAGSG